MEQPKPKYKKGDKIVSLLGFKGKVESLYYSEVSKEWIYQMIDGNKPIGMFKETNLK